MKMSFSIIPQDDPSQALRIRRTLLALSMAGILLVTSCAMYYRGLFRFSFTGFIFFSLTLWIGHFSIFTIMRTGLNKRFADPSLTFVQIFWAATCVMLTAYFLNGLRPVVLMLFLVAMLFGFLRLNFRELMHLSLYTISLYGVVIGLLYRFHPEFIDTDKEIIVWFSFSLVLFCFALMGRQINHMREKLQTQNIRLRQEIGERKRAQEEAQFRKAYFEGLVDNMPDGIAIFDDNGAVKTINPQFTNLFGYSEEEAVGQNLSELVGPPECLEEARSYLRRIVSGERMDVETVRKSKDGTRIEVSLRATPVTVNDVKIGNLAIYRDISSRKKAEKEKEKLQFQLLQARKMEAIGTLTGGIAHDYNNLLSIIMGNLSMAMEEAKPGSLLLGFLNEIDEASGKVRDLTHELMSLSRGGAPVKIVGPLRKLLRDALDSIPTDSGIFLEISISRELWQAPYDPYKMGAVFRNVVTNAAEAMPEGGTITIRAENLRVEDAGRDSGLPLKPGDYVHISIQDQGKGIPGENLDKIFDPYFSTKALGVQKGMGLGLATAYAIVQKHGGHILIETTPDVGTTVNIYLPASERGSRNSELGAQDKSPQSELGIPHSAIRRVLLMDDEEMLRNLAEQMLKKLGYAVETVRDGVEAIEAYKKQKYSGEPYEAVILDLTIKGGMGGEQTIRELLKIDPDIRAIVSSGYFNDPVMSHYAEHGFRGALAKPYQKDDLERLLKEILG